MADDRDAFVTRYGSVFEHSPWVAEAAYERGPFADRGELLEAMTAATLAVYGRLLAERGA